MVKRAPEAAPDNTIEDARVRSKHCPDCHGQGFAVRWRRHRPFDQPFNQTETFYCLCPLGRAIEANHRLYAPEVRRRMHDLEDYPAFRMIEHIDDNGEVTYSNPYTTSEEK